MAPVNMHEAKSKLSALINALETGAEREILIARKGQPVARLIALGAERPRRRGGLAKGRYVVPEGINREDEEIRRLFEDGPIFPDG